MISLLKFWKWTPVMWLLVIFACIGFNMFTGCAANVYTLAQKQLATKPVSTTVAVAPTTAPAPTKAVPGQPAAQPTVAQPGQPTNAAPTVKATVPAGPTTVAAQPTVAAKDPCAGLPEMYLAVAEGYTPYTLEIFSALQTGCQNGVNIHIVTAPTEQRQVPWALGIPLDNFVPPLTAEERKDPLYSIPSNVTRAVLTTQNSAALYADARPVDVIDQSNGADGMLTLAKSGSKPLTTWDDVIDRVTAGGGAGNVNEFMPKALAWGCGYRPGGRYISYDSTAAAAEAFVKGDSPAEVLSVYETYLSDVLRQNPNVQLRLTSKTFVGIWDVMVIGKNADQKVVSKAILAYSDAFKIAMEDPDRAWDVLYAWAYGPEGTEARQNLLGTSNKDEWKQSIAQAAMATPEQRLALFSSAKFLLAERMFQAQEAFKMSPSIRSDGSKVIVPNISPWDYLHVQGPMDLVKNDPKMHVKVNVPNNDFILSSYAPASKGTKVLSYLPYLSYQRIGFKAGTNEFADPKTASDEMTARLLQCMKLFKVNLQISGSADELGQARARTIQNFFVRTWSVPTEKLPIVSNASLPAGSISLAIVGTEE